MTKTWGPLGWATLHSVAALFPDSPTENEKALVARWVESFRMCIVCDICKRHFTTLFSEYKQMYPDWNQSRKNFTLFVIRAHNTVNLRQTSKPVLTVEEAVSHLRMNIPEDKARAMRQSYIVHIRAEWSKSLNMDGVTAAKYIRELITAETEYWAHKSFSWNDVEALVKFENVSPLPSKEPRRIGAVAIRPPQAKVTFTAPTTRPRFSFLSR